MKAIKRHALLGFLALIILFSLVACSENGESANNDLDGTWARSGVTDEFTFNGRNFHRFLYLAASGSEFHTSGTFEIVGSNIELLEDDGRLVILTFERRRDVNGNTVININGFDYRRQ